MCYKCVKYPHSYANEIHLSIKMPAAKSEEIKIDDEDNPWLRYPSVRESDAPVTQWPSIRENAMTKTAHELFQQLQDELLKAETEEDPR